MQVQKRAELKTVNKWGRFWKFVLLLYLEYHDQSTVETIIILPRLTRGRDVNGVSSKCTVVKFHSSFDVLLLKKLNFCTRNQEEQAIP